MSTRFQFCVNIGTRGSAVCGSEDSMPQAMSAVFRYATYYLGHHREVSAEVREVCAECDGNGTVPPKRGFTPRRCPSCKGKSVAFETAFPCVPGCHTLDNGTGEIVTHN